jgi:competence protein ComEC
LDLVVLSHPHPDHYGGLFAVLRQIEVGELWDTGQAEAEDPSGQAAALLSLARARGVRVRGPRALCNAPQKLADVRLTVLAPCPGFDPGYDPNDNSLVLRLDHGKRRFLFAGDAEAHEEAELVRRHGRALAADVLKVGHHGSRTSSTPPWLDRVQPWLAVISAGRGNPFGHPHPQALSHLSRQAAHVLTTAQRGGVRVFSDGDALIVDAWDRSLALASHAASAREAK